ncbi:MAG: hypothetical protein RL281_586, partial [Pseudomonadota bacterium]
MKQGVVQVGGCGVRVAIHTRAHFCEVRKIVSGSRHQLLASLRDGLAAIARFGFGNSRHVFGNDAQRARTLRPQEARTLLAEDFAPHDVTFYLRDLAACYHSYYDAERILVEDEEVRLARLALVAATRQVLHNGLALLGVVIAVVRGRQLPQVEGDVMRRQVGRSAREHGRVVGQLEHQRGFGGGGQQRQVGLLDGR